MEKQGVTLELPTTGEKRGNKSVRYEDDVDDLVKRVVKKQKPESTRSKDK